MLAFLVIFGSFTVFANDKTSEEIAEERALEKINELSLILDGKYFTTTQKPCHNNSCSKCKNLNVTSCDWFVDIFGYSVKKSQMPSQYFPSGRNVKPEGWSCFGFSVFAQWYIFSPSNDGTIGSDVTCVATYLNDRSVKFNYETLTKYARPGDAIRISTSGDDGHSVIFVSCDEKGVTVLDNNYIDSNQVGLHKISYSASYGGSAISKRGISITRANNYDTVSTGTTCAALCEESSVDFLYVDCPIVHVKGRSYTLSGSIISGKIIDSVGVKLLDAKTEKTVFEYTQGVGRRTFSLAGSELDKNTKFNNFKKGVYFLEYTVTDISGYSESLRLGSFSVYDTAHECSLDGIEYVDGKIICTCVFCGRFEVYDAPSYDEDTPSQDNNQPPLFTPDIDIIPPQIDTSAPLNPPATVCDHGDINVDGTTDASDAIYLLYHVFFESENYPIGENCDFDGSSLVDARDAIYLLYHIFFGSETYPINE